MPADAPARSASTVAPAARAALLLAVAGVAVQLAYPLLHGQGRDVATVLIVVLLAVAVLVHATATRGLPAAALLFVITAGVGFAVEQLGVHSGVPFGSYAYSSALGGRWAGVPPLIALAWTMLAWPSAVAAHALVSGRLARVLVGTWALAGLDLFLDPQMVRAGYWRWHHPSPHLPGVAHIPLTNYAGWLAVSFLVSLLVQRLLDLAPAQRGSDLLPLALYAWLCVGWIVALAVFLPLAAAAGWGALACAPVLVPLLLRMVEGWRP